MRKVITDKGHEVLEAVKLDLPPLGIKKKNCEKCGSVDTKKVYYLPLLHKIYCVKCFNSWSETASYFPEDSLYEKSEFDRLGIAI